MCPAAPSLGAQHKPPFSSAHGSRLQTKGVRNPLASDECNLVCQPGLRDRWAGEET